MLAMGSPMRRAPTGVVWPPHLHGVTLTRAIFVLSPACLCALTQAHDTPQHPDFCHFRNPSPRAPHRPQCIHCRQDCWGWGRRRRAAAARGAGRDVVRGVEVVEAGWGGVGSRGRVQGWIVGQAWQLVEFRRALRALCPLSMLCVCVCVCVCVCARACVYVLSGVSCGFDGMNALCSCRVNLSRISLSLSSVGCAPVARLALPTRCACVSRRRDLTTPSASVVYIQRVALSSPAPTASCPTPMCVHALNGVVGRLVSDAWYALAASTG